MIPLIFNLGPTELLIILAIVLLLFGGARLAGLGKSTGRAIREFKEETKGLDGAKTTPPEQSVNTDYHQPPVQPVRDPAEPDNPSRPQV